MKTVTTPITPIANVRTLITDSLEASFEHLYNISVVGKLTRSQKSVDSGNLQFIDYTFACFEAAQVLHDSPHDIASQLTIAIQEVLRTQGYDTDITLESISGYINFQLSNAVLASAVSLAASDYRSVPRLALGKDVQFIVAGPAIGQDLDAGEARSISQLKELAELAGYEAHICYMLADYSEDATQALSALLQHDVSIGTKSIAPKHGFGKQSIQNLQLAQLHRRIRHTIASPESMDAEGNILDALRSVRTESLATWDTALRAAGISPDKVLLESELSAKVQQYLDVSIRLGSSHAGIVGDDGSQAAYYISQDVVVPLRTSAGFLYNAAYWLYVVQTRLESRDMLTTIFAVPTACKQLLEEVSKGAAHTAIQYLALTTLDMGKTSEGEVTGVQALLAGVGETLDAMNHRLFDDTMLRREIIAVIDGPAQLQEAITSVNLSAGLHTVYRARQLADRLAQSEV